MKEKRESEAHKTTGPKRHKCALSTSAWLKHLPAHCWAPETYGGATIEEVCCPKRCVMSWFVGVSKSATSAN